MRHVTRMLVLISLGTTTELFPQWEAPRNLSATDSTSRSFYNNGRWIATEPGGYVHVFWQEQHRGLHLAYKQSSDNGSTWSDTVLFRSIGSNAYSPATAASNDIVHLVYWSYFPGGWIGYLRSTDHGSAWSNPIILYSHQGNTEDPSIAAEGNNVHVVWRDYQYTMGSFETYYIRSTTGGTTWGPVVNLSADPEASFGPSVAVEGNTVHVAWWQSYEPRQRIVYKRSTNNGSTWSASVVLSEDTSYSRDVCIAADGDFVHAVWCKNDAASEVYYKRSTDAGATWSPDVRLTNAPGVSWFPSIDVSGQFVHLTWMDNRTGIGDIYYKRSTDAGLAWEEDARLSASPSNLLFAFYSSIAHSGPTVHVVWSQYLSSGSIDIHYTRNPLANVTSVETGNEPPASFALFQNYPNPFNPRTSFRFSVPNNGTRSRPPRADGQVSGSKLVTLKVYDVLGREVATLVNGVYPVNGVKEPGTYEVEWDASGFASGVYFYRLTAGNFVETKRMVLIR